jgi:ribose transport system ATP-binding protein
MPADSAHSAGDLAGEGEGSAAGSAGHAPAELLTMRAIVKRFPGVTALDGVDLTVREGEVHCLLGQNGAGKSTLIKILSGAHARDAGEIHWRGERYAPSGPTDATRLGIATIYQELDLVDGLSVAENIQLGHEHARFGFIRRREATARAEALLTRLGHPDIPPGREVGRLPAAGRQVVSIARALSHDVRLLVMDEPSAVLAHAEVENLFRVIRELTAQGVAVVYISHRLAEIREIGDRVTVLKDGRTIGTGLPARSTPTAELVRMIAGRDVEYAIPPRLSKPPKADAESDAPPLLRVESLTLPGHFADIAFELHPGEILGLAGLVGSGRSEILETVHGARLPSAGSILMDGQPLHRPGLLGAFAGPSRAVRAGVGLAPEERKSQGLLMQADIGENIVLSTLSRFSRHGRLDRRSARTAATGQIAELDVRPADPRREVRTLSGGNQQKTVLARWLLHGCRLLLLDEPTRGVDVSTRAELYGIIRRLADEGVGVLLVSSDVPEVLGLADRVLVLREGRIVHRADTPAELTEEQVLNLVMEEASAV